MFELMHKVSAKQRKAARRNIKKARCVSKCRRKRKGGKKTKLATCRTKCHVKEVGRAHG